MSTITREFTKEQLIAEARANIETMTAALSGGITDSPRRVARNLRLNEIALASLEAEKTILYRERNPYNCLTTGWQELTDDEYEFIKDNAGENAEFRTVFTAPPSTVSVPDELTREEYKRRFMEDDDFDDTFRGGWNACRAAMLQGADGNSPVIQDGSEDTKRLDWLEAQNKRLNEYYGTTYGWKFDANFQRNAMMLNDSNYPVMTVRQAIDEAIATAPQQGETAKPKK